MYLPEQKLSWARSGKGIQRRDICTTGLFAAIWHTHAQALQLMVNSYTPGFSYSAGCVRSPLTSCLKAFRKPLWLLGAKARPGTQLTTAGIPLSHVAFFSASTLR